MTGLVGHERARAAFGDAMKSGALHHAWLLAGPEGVGKARFAREAAVRLIGGGDRDRETITRREHPDVPVLTREVWDKTSPPNVVPLDERSDSDRPARGIRVAQVRSLRARLSVRPTLSDRRPVIVDAADDLEREAANALLKVLEEPPAGTVFLLVSHSPGRLLPTVRSRCRLLRLEPLSDEEVGRVLATELPDAGEDERAALVRVGEGAPGRALSFAGLDVGGLDAALARIAATGDPDNAERGALAEKLGSPAAQPRYEALLERAPAALAAAARGRTGLALRAALDAYAAARDLAAVAAAQSLDPRATTFELAGLVARLASRD